eukprot:Hpha_TRINITY_DN16146_c0_g2::TRINITY_DN16146_c0_g2_i1::g.3730::m.3730
MGAFSWLVVLTAVGLGILLGTESGFGTTKEVQARFSPGEDGFVRYFVSVPRTVGWQLQLMGMLLRTPVIGGIVADQIYAQNGLRRPREFASAIDDWPLLMPLSPAGNDNAKGEEAGVRAGEGPGGFLTVSDYHEAFKTGKMDPVSVAKEAMRKAKEKVGPKQVNAFLSINEEATIAEAQRSAARWKAGKPLGPFDGVPVAVKTEMDVKGFNTTLGTSFLHLAHGPAASDALPVRRLRAAGAVVIGVTAMHELGLGTTGYNPHLGALSPRNPRNLAHYTGGSSSGSAAAVAAGIVPVAIGADGGGSIRIPASLCGVVGLKATFARIPGENDLDWSVGHIGPLALTVRDAALAYSVLAGADEAVMPGSSVQPQPHTRGFEDSSLKGVTLCRMSDWNKLASAVQKEALKLATDKWQKAGAVVVDVILPQLDVMQQAHAITILSEMASKTDSHHQQFGEFGAEAQIGLSLARRLSARDFIASQKVRAHLMRRWKAVFKNGGGQCDGIITPTTETTAPLFPDDAVSHGESNIELTSKLMTYVIPGNFLGFPALSVPGSVQEKSTGLPTAVQIYADHWNEALTLRLARVIEH